MQAHPVAHDIWTQILAAVQDRVNDQTYRTWFTPLRPKAIEHNRLTLVVPNPFFVDWLKEHHVETIESAAASVLDRPVDVQLLLSSEYADRALPACPLPKPNGIATRPPVPPLAALAGSEPPSDTPSPLNRRFTFENFVVGKSNEFCVAACEAVATSLGQIYNPLFIYGGVGLGKTHIMQAIGNHQLEGHRAPSIRYVSAEKFMNEMIEAIGNRTASDFRRTYRTADILLIDDIQFLAGKPTTQEEFFHTFNSLYDAHRQIVITADRPPRELKDLEERLVSRFNWGLVTDISPPDFETRAAILRRKAEQEELTISDDVILLIAERISTNVRELEGSLVRLSALASFTKRPIDLQLAESFLKDLMSRRSAAHQTPATILAAVARRYDVGVDLIRGKRRTSRIVFPRQVAMYLTKQLTGLPYAEIGAFYGRDHTTVLYACEKIDRVRTGDPELDRTLEELREALKGRGGEDRPLR